MKKLLALINWPTKDDLNDNIAEEFDHLFTLDYQSQRNPAGDTQPMVRIGKRDPTDVQKAIDLAG